MSLNHGVLFPERPTASNLADVHISNPFFEEFVIRNQPSSQPIDLPLQRRPIPISTQDWISTTSTHLSPISAEYFLANVEQLEIQLVVDLNTLLGQSKNGNQYRVKVRGAETLFLSLENSTQWQRKLFGSSRSCEIILRDASGEHGFSFTKNLSWGCVPLFLHKMAVETTQLIGNIEQEFSVLGPRFRIYDENNKIIGYIEGPNICCCCMTQDVNFHILSADKTCQIASISHQWDHLLVDNILLLTFSESNSVRLKSLLLGAAFLLQTLYFDRLSESSHNTSA